MPNHWHALAAIWAIQAGKDVYLEKPVCHNISEGRRIIETARKYKRICQTGTQCRSARANIEAVEFLRSGKIGEVKLARALCYKSRGSIGSKGVYTPPESVDYDLWCGPAPLEALTRPKLHYDWHWIWSTGNGDLGNQGVHQVDVARWGLGINSLPNSVLTFGGRFGYQDAGQTPNTEVTILDFKSKTMIVEVRGLKTDAYKGVKIGNIFEGSDGYVVMTSYNSGAAFDRDGNQIETFSGDGDHFANFFKAVRSRNKEDLNADIQEGFLSSAICHMGNISYQLGQTTPASEVIKRLEGLTMTDDVQNTINRTIDHLKENQVSLEDDSSFRYGQLLKLDATKELFIDNDKANQMLSREYRPSFIVPSATQI